MKTSAEIIRAEAARHGVLPFARFMELALYHPDQGYYEKQKDNVGRRGDFYTSVSTGELFGQLLAFQFSEWLEGLRVVPQTGDGLRIVEAGAHDGRLAGDVLAWLQRQRPELFARLEYLIIEPSVRRQEWQRETLKQFAPRVRWLSQFNRSAIQQLNGIIFSNELLDAFPVHRYGWDAGKKTWFEWGVVVEGEKFTWARMQNCGLRLADCGLEAALPDGYTIETSPAAENWWREAAKVLDHGKLLAIDYGLAADELFSPVRSHGTLRAYRRHRVTDDILADPGEQDLTAHVNFPAIQAAGEAAGLTTESFQTQTQFLTRILSNTLKDGKFGEWNARRTRQFQTLTHPEHLGRAFRVLVQSR